MLSGAHFINFDSKGRLSLPIKIKQKFDTNTVTVTAHPHGCLLFFLTNIGKKSRQIFLFLHLWMNKPVFGKD